MKKQITFLLSFFLFSNLIMAQNIIEWTDDYRLNLTDFQSTASSVNDSMKMHSFAAASAIEFFYQMSQYEFMFTKNFNSKVTTTFNKNASYIATPDSSVAKDLVLFSQYNFDLYELYARRLRKELYEKKKTLSNASFFKPIYEDLLAQLNEENSKIFSQYNFGKNKAALTLAHDQVKEKLELLSDFCKACKPPKR